MGKGILTAAAVTDKPSPHYAKSDGCHTAACKHDDLSQRHDAVSEYEYAQGKERKAQHHQEVSGLHMIASGHYRKAGKAYGDRNEDFGQNHEDRAAAQAKEAEDYTAKHGLHLQRGPTNVKVKKPAKSDSDD